MSEISKMGLMGQDQQQLDPDHMPYSGGTMQPPSIGGAGSMYVPNPGVPGGMPQAGGMGVMSDPDHAPYAMGGMSPPVKDFGTIPGMGMATSGQGSSQAMKAPQDSEDDGAMGSLQKSLPGVAERALGQIGQPGRVSGGQIHPSAGAQMQPSNFQGLQNHGLRQYLQGRRGMQ